MISFEQITRLYSGLIDSQNTLIVSRNGFTQGSGTNNTNTPQGNGTAAAQTNNTTSNPAASAGQTPPTVSSTPGNPVDAVTLRETAQALLNANSNILESNRALTLANLATPARIDANNLSQSLSITLANLLVNQPSRSQAEAGLPASYMTTGAASTTTAPSGAQFHNNVNQQNRSDILSPAANPATVDQISTTNKELFSIATANASTINPSTRNETVEIFRTGGINPSMDFAEFLQNTLQGETARGSAGGLLSMVVLNAAMIPGWPAPPPFAPLPLKKAEAIHNAIMQSKIKDEGEIMEYLASLGLNKGLLDKVMSVFRGVEEKTKLVLWLSTLMVVVSTILRTLSKDLAEEMSLLDEDALEANKDENKNSGKRARVFMS